MIIDRNNSNFITILMDAIAPDMELNLHECGEEATLSAKVGRINLRVTHSGVNYKIKIFRRDKLKLECMKPFKRDPDQSNGVYFVFKLNKLTEGGQKALAQIVSDTIWSSPMSLGSGIYWTEDFDKYVDFHLEINGNAVFKDKNGVAFWYTSPLIKVEKHGNGYIRIQTENHVYNCTL